MSNSMLTYLGSFTGSMEVLLNSRIVQPLFILGKYGAQSLFEVSARLADGKELLRDALSTITNEFATTKMTNIAIRIIQKSVLPLMDIASHVSRTSANVVGPIAGGNYAHRREEGNRKKMIKSTKVTQKTGLVMVNEFVHGHSPPLLIRGCS